MCLCLVDDFKTLILAIPVLCGGEGEASVRDLRLERFLENVRRALTSCLLGSLCLDCNLGSSIYCAGFD